MEARAGAAGRDRKCHWGRVAARTAGSIASVVTMPVDVVKTWIMLAAATSFDGKGAGRKAADAILRGERR